MNLLENFKLIDDFRLDNVNREYIKKIEYIHITSDYIYDKCIIDNESINYVNDIEYDQDILQFTLWIKDSDKPLIFSCKNIKSNTENYKCMVKYKELDSLFDIPNIDKLFSGFLSINNMQYYLCLFCNILGKIIFENEK